MTKPTKRARKNPADLTRRNNDARKRQINDLKLRIKYLERYMRDGFEILYKKIEALSKWQQDVIGGGNFKRGKKK